VNQLSSLNYQATDCQYTRQSKRVRWSRNRYISQDPIRLLSDYNFYSYIKNPSGWVDTLGLSGTPIDKSFPGGRTTFTSSDGLTLEVRAVRDLSHVKTGTLEAMSKHGFAPKDVNGEGLVLHHHQQRAAGPIIELPANKHSIWNKAQHPHGNAKGKGLTPEERDLFNKWRTEYWKQRAENELQKRGAKAC